MNKKILLFCLLAISAATLSASILPSAYEKAGDHIRTRWAADVTPDKVLQEYPRPQMVRQDWINLNGLWDYAVTSSAADVMPGVEGRILVPFCPESSLSGVGRAIQPDQALWYGTEVTVPGKWKGKRVLLHFGAVDWSCEVWVNGKHACHHTGGYTSFSIDVTNFLKDGKAKIVLKVTDPTDDDTRPVPHGKQKRSPHGIWYTPVTGIWQTVWMEAVSKEGYINGYDAVSNLENGTISVTVRSNTIKSGDKLQVEVFTAQKGLDPTQLSCSKSARLGKAIVNASEPATVKLSNPQLWTPDDPFLYGLRISILRGGKIIDRVYGYSAIRAVTVKEDAKGVKRLALNGNILFQYGPLDQGWWPDGLYTAPTDEALVFDVKATKELGFNMIRKHIKVEPARWYYHCDREGIMVWQDMPCIGSYKNRSDWGQGADVYGAGRDYYAITEEAKRNYYKEWSEIIEQLRIFPSIVMWVPFNEAWGQFDTQKVVDFTRKLDPTRLINAASGGNWIKGAGDIVDSHYYPAPKMRLVDSSKVNVLGEYGGIGYPVQGHTWARNEKSWGYIKFASTEDVTDCYVNYAEQLRHIIQNDRCAAAVYTQTTDVELEVNGFYTYDREILKMNLERVRQINKKVISTPVISEINMIPESSFHGKVDGKTVNLYTLSNGRITAQITNFGARVISLFTPDREGHLDDIAVGYDNLEKFVHNSGERFLGATVGRVANRICRGQFTLDGKQYTLPVNNGLNSLHGGLKGIDMVVWTVEESLPASLTLSYLAPDGQDGYPGNMKITLKFTLTEDDALDLQYTATTDAACPVNLSQHTFFNLKGSAAGTITDHVISIDADNIVPVDETLIPTGSLLPVDGTPFDFRKPHVIGERIGCDHEQIKNGNGYDHCWALNGKAGEYRKVCTLSEQSTGRVMEIYTDQPGMQFYAGNFFDGTYCGKVKDCPIGFRDALALETSNYPDAVNQPLFPNSILRPGETYTQHTAYKFSVK